MVSFCTTVYIFTGRQGAHMGVRGRVCVCVCVCTYTYLYLQGEAGDDGGVELSQCNLEGLAYSSVITTLEGTHLTTGGGEGVG